MNPIVGRIGQIAAVVAVAMLVIGFIAGSLFIRAVDDAVDSTIEGETAAVRILEGVDLSSDDIDIIFGPIVAGERAQLVTDDAWLADNLDALWFEPESGAGPVIGAVVMGLMGMPPEQHIATVYRNGTAIERFACLSVSCLQDFSSGMGDFEGRLPGQPVRQTSTSFADHDAYLAAHRAAAADRQSWFTRPGGEAPLPPDSGLRTAIITWPTQLVPLPPDFVPGREDPEARARIDDWLAALIDDTEARQESVHFVERMPLWLMRNGEGVHDGSGTVSLDAVSIRNVTIRIEVPVDALAELEERYRTMRPPPGDLSALAPAIEEAFVKQGFDTACLPACGDVDRSRLVEEPSFDRTGDPFWTLDLWQLAPEAG